MSDQGMFPEALKSLTLSSTLVALIGVALVIMPGVTSQAICGCLWITHRKLLVVQSLDLTYLWFMGLV